MGYPFLDLKPQYESLKDELAEQIQKVLNHGQFILGPEVAECEQALREFINVRHTICCANGTDALMMSLLAFNIGSGDEVIVPAFSFFATAGVVSLLGATPKFVDIKKESYNIDPELIEEAITEKTKAILPTSLYGQPADMDRINQIASSRGIPVIEDAAQSFGATYNGEKSCHLSTIGCTSFFPAKPLGCYGDGGAVFCDDDHLAKILRQLRVHGDASHYDHVRIGLNGRMDTLQCAILLTKLKRFPWEITQRQKIASRYSEELKGLNMILPTVQNDRTSAWAQYTVFLENRSGVQEKLKDRGIPTAVHYPKPIPRQPVYEGLAGEKNFPISDWAASGVLSLPLYPDLPESTQEAIITAIKEIC